MGEGNETEAGAVVRVETPPTPPARVRRRWIPVLAGVGGGLVVLLGAAAIAGVVIAGEYSPQARAEQFLTALVEGSASDAVAQLASKPNGLSLLGGGFYDAATDHIESFAIDDVDAEEGAATVTTEVTQDGETYTAELELAIVGPAGPFGLFADWRVEDSALPVVEVTFPRPDEVDVAAGGVTIAAYPDAARVFVTVLPGTYSFGAAQTHPLLDIPSVDAVARLGEPATALVTVELTEEGMQTARQAVDAFIASCVAQPVLEPAAGCGLQPSPREGQTYTNLRWSMPTAPAYEVGPWTHEGVPVVGTSPGAFRLDADFSSSEGYGTAWWTFDSYELGGTIELVDGALTFTSWYE